MPSSVAAVPTLPLGVGRWDRMDDALAAHARTLAMKSTSFRLIHFPDLPTMSGHHEESRRSRQPAIRGKVVLHCSGMWPFPDGNRSGRRQSSMMQTDGGLMTSPE